MNGAAATKRSFSKSPRKTDMVAPAGKTPRHQLSEQERRLCLEALLSDRHARRVRRAQQKDNGDMNTERRKRGAKRTTAEMEVAQSKARATPSDMAEAKIEAPVQAAAEAKDTSSKKKRGAKEVAEVAQIVVAAATKSTPTGSVARVPEKKAAAKSVASTVISLQGASSAGPSPEPTVSEVVADMVASVEISEQLFTTERAPRHTVEPVPGTGKRRRNQQSSQRKRRRSVLQDDVIESSGDESCNEPSTAFSILSCIIDSDPNLMSDGADRCTGLNADEDSDLDAEPEEEEEEEANDDDWDGDWEIGSLTDEDSDAGREEIPDSVWSSAAKNKHTITLMRDSGWEYGALYTSKFGPDPTYEGLYDGPYGPSDSILNVADDPLALFFYFLPPKLWAQIAVESNTYHRQSISLRARSLRSQQRRDSGDVEDLGEIRRRLAAVIDIEAWKVLTVVALLIARMLVPIRKGIAAHWSLKKVGAQPANRFGTFMPKNRFFHIMGYLHFSNNKSPQAHRDRAWKIRPVVDVLQRTFARGYKMPPPVISFDDATLPSRSRYNPMRQFNKDKPHRWGTKVFVAACAETAYCMRWAHLQTPVPKDNNSGEAAVLRNMNALIPPSLSSPWRLVVTDRFYTSVKLAFELLHRRHYLTGTMQTDRSGYVKDVITAKTTRTVNKRKVIEPPQGLTKLAQNKLFPQITAAMWTDRNPVHMLSSGGSRESCTVSKLLILNCYTRLSC
ncbi:unnamed protein product [Phytophthora fragariaefolia]|uniref:Unnamed protein product n=1 Tax=Phytophthora fragariaefolia TaxID=1490495 RepID=A0A9W6X5K2_9STRA|nr:unnamed protein product [Phytophthora fragariaefolia]